MFSPRSSFLCALHDPCGDEQFVLIRGSFQFSAFCFRTLCFLNSPSSTFICVDPCASVAESSASFACFAVKRISVFRFPLSSFQFLNISALCFRNFGFEMVRRPSSALG